MNGFQLFDQPPKIPNSIEEITLFKLKSKQYYEKLKTFVWIFLEISATILILGIIWINIEWVKIVVSIIAIAISLFLFLLLFYII